MDYFTGGKGLKGGKIGRVGTIYLKVLSKDTKKPATLDINNFTLDVKGPEPDHHPRYFMGKLNRRCNI